ncbi:MAG: metallophosphoesterase [Kiritimatiellae bacterium]|nr:metallophosphoesterase [Kiritimatiellia bacterium]
MPCTWFTSDYHLGHWNIIRLCDRPFANVEEMDQAIIERHNACVGNADTVYDLGDFAFRCSAEYAAARLHRLNGRRRLLLGNHDKPLRQAHKRGLLDDLMESDRLTLIGDSDPRVQTALRVSIEGQEIVLAHFAQRSWHGAFRGSWHLYGHSHGNLGPFHKSMDVGVDPNDFCPISFTDIKSRMIQVQNTFAED